MATSRVLHRMLKDCVKGLRAYVFKCFSRSCEQFVKDV